jgi:hypothetical protein
VDPGKTVKARCDAVGLGEGAPAPPTATIRTAFDRGPARFATLRSRERPTASTRELPKISVELRGTLSGPPLDEAASSKRERDLEVIGTLGEGGMGRVFLARQHSLDRDVAVKTVRDSAADPERAALLAEGAITGHLEHPGVVPVHALGLDEDDRPLLVMKRVEGAPWSELMNDPRHAAWEHLGGDPDDRLDGHLGVLMQVCNAVDFAHSRGIVHRDIKPENVLIGRYGEVYLADWGLALRIDGDVPPQPLCGTPAYMAPEMVSGRTIDARTDVYLLGATLHQIVTGAPRHDASNIQATLHAALESAPKTYPPSVPEELAAIANDATAADPAKRPASAAAVRQRIADYLRHKASVALARSAEERLAKLRALLGNVERLASEDRQREIDVLGAEAGFAFEQALREWADNRAAQKGAADLRELLAKRQSRAAKLERLAQDLDPGVSRRQRALGLGAVAVVGVGLSVSGFVTNGRDLTTSVLLRQSLGPFAASVISALVLRKHVLRTALNRRSTAGVIAITASIAADRALALLAGVPAAQVLVFDCVVACAIAGLTSWWLFPWLAWPAAVMAGAAVWAAASPEQAMTAFSAGTGVSLVASVFFAARMMRGETNA